VPDRYLQNDMEMLIGLWREILSKRDSVQPPSQLYAEPDLILRAARDLFTTDLHRMVLDREEDHRRVVGFAERFMPKAVQQIELYTGREPVFDAYGIELEISRALSRKVWLKSGGYIVIDHTEAMTCVDVNTGRYVGDTSLEETIVRINLEAVEEIVYQLRLRGIGGLIILDFIDMERPGNRELVFDALQKALLTDKVKTHALPISEFGLVEMTRKRVRESIVQFLCEECPYCEGKGHVKSRETVAYEIMRELLREASALAGEELTVQANPEVIAVLTEQEREALKTIERGASKTIHLVPNRAFHVEQYELATDV
jgi:ribonuclease G